MKLLSLLEIGSACGGISVKPGGKHHGPSFDLHGNCNISMSGYPYTTAWDASNMTMDVPYQVDVTRDLEYETLYITYNVTKHAHGCEFYLMKINMF